MVLDQPDGARWDPTWRSASWLNPPPSVRSDDGDLLVTAAGGSDFWRVTAYGFVHDSGHALLTPFEAGTAIEVTFVLDYDQQFDQAGVLLRADERTWIKAGVEVSDGIPQLGAVVTREVSDWSAAPVPQWAGREVTVRASRTGDAVTVRARVDAEPWQLVRLAPIEPAASFRAGPFCCAPTRDGLVARFRGSAITAADEVLHPS